jgi:hypothetical protein
MYKLGQIVRMKKKHPCGEDRWAIIRIGMDFRIKCTKCSRSILMPRQKFEKMVKSIMEEPVDE